ncbi:MAG: spore cortex-lytic enzyme [Oscillospiraceae bacterium]|nr:spore cortex-lytic enzyme [Oscillospiraceae bacterium]
MKSLLKISIPTLLVAMTLSLYSSSVNPPKRGSIAAYSQYGFSGEEVEAIQRTMRDWGVYHGEITGYYGPQTEEAVRRVQRHHGLKVNGIADNATLQVLGLEINESPMTASQAEVNLLARMISAEGRGEPYEGQVAIGAVIMNRINHPSFPDSLSGVLYQDGAFTALVDGQFNEPIAESAYSAARDAINGWDPSGGAIYYHNPKKHNNAFMNARPVITVIGDHLFCS